MLTKYGIDNIIIMIAAGLIFIGLSIYLSKPWAYYTLLPIGILLILFTFWFFRDPERELPNEFKNDISLIVSPCDGKVLFIKEVEEKEFFKKQVTQISIFLSPLDVHVNRIPISGIVKYFKYNPGDYLVAYHPKASDLNEQTHIGIENQFGKLFFRQIVGILARRLVWDIKENDTVKVGDRFGMMKFGSRIDILLDDNSDIYVKPGDVLKAGITKIGKLNK